MVEEAEVREILEKIRQTPELLDELARVIEESVRRNRPLQNEITKVVDRKLGEALRRRGVFR